MIRPSSGQGLAGRSTLNRTRTLSYSQHLNVRRSDGNRHKGGGTAMARASTDDMNFTAVRTSSIVSEVYAQIREKLLSGEFLAGQPLRESVLATRMAVSRAPVREALRLLEQSGLIVKAHNRSYVVAPSAPGDMPELAALRAADEILAIRILVQRKTDLGPLAAVVDGMRAAQANSDVETISALDIEFHMTLVRLTGLPRLISRYDQLRDQIRFAMLSVEDLHGRVLQDQAVMHEELLTALLNAQQSGRAADLLRLWEEHVFFSMNPADHIIPLHDDDPA
ncbi:GntR family transcriptional regulator [Sphingobium sp. YC-XJ3]|nr:GntR family transcriptional regulator [Sphingobium sp. YC-XJ3]WDA36788.1 GntR family transcriptional regulator [Sphingobium sp. YC-XJ3]